MTIIDMDKTDIQAVPEGRNIEVQAYMKTKQARLLLGREYETFQKLGAWISGLSKTSSIDAESYGVQSSHVKINFKLRTSVLNQCIWHANQRSVTVGHLVRYYLNNSPSADNGKEAINLDSQTEAFKGLDAGDVAVYCFICTEAAAALSSADCELIGSFRAWLTYLHTDQPTITKHLPQTSIAFFSIRADLLKLAAKYAEAQRITVGDIVRHYMDVVYLEDMHRIYALRKQHNYEKTYALDAQGFLPVAPYKTRVTTQEK